MGAESCGCSIAGGPETEAEVCSWRRSRSKEKAKMSRLEDAGGHGCWAHLDGDGSFGGGGGGGGGAGGAPGTKNRGMAV